MELIELETGLYLDIKIQDLLKKILSVKSDQMLVIDEYHGNDVILVFEQVATSMNPIIKRTVILDSAYKVKLYNYNNMQFIQINNDNLDYSIFVILLKNFYNWKNELTNLQKRLYI